MLELTYADEFVDVFLFRQRSNLGQAKRLYHLASSTEEEVLLPETVQFLYDRIIECEQRQKRRGFY
jgi:hypothetical protein